MTHMDQPIINTLNTESNRLVGTYCGIAIMWNERWREYRVTDDENGITYLFHTIDEAERMTAKLNGGPILRRLALLCDRMHHMDTDPNSCGWHRQRATHS